MQVLVTGAAGMIGSHIVDACLARGDTVFALDDLSRGQLNNVANKAEFVKLDIQDEVGLRLWRQRFKSLDAIVHQASIINEGIDAENINVDISVNIRGTLNLLHLAADVGVRRFIYASSVAVYGRPVHLPASEVGTPPEPIASYGIGKLAAEHYVRYAANATPDLSYANLRYANIYGPRQPLLGEVGVIRFFIEALAGGRCLTVHGDGSQFRDFLYIDDCVDATLAALDSDLNMTLNIGSGIPTSVNQIVDTLKQLVSDEFVLRHTPTRHGEIGEFWCDIEAAKTTLDWFPTISLIDGIARTYDWRQAI